MFAFSDNAEKLLFAKKNFFKNINDFKPKSERSLQFKNVYQACMNENGSISEEKEFILAEAETLSKIKTNSELASLAQNRLELGLTSFTYIWDGPNKENPLINDAIIVSDMRSLPERTYYQNKALIEDFKSILIEFFKTVKMNNPEQRAQWVIEIETDLAMKAPLPKDIRGRFSEKRDISRADFLNKYPELKI